MASVAENNKPKNPNHPGPNASASPITTSTNIARNFKIQQDNKSAEENEVQQEKQTRVKYRPTRVALNDTLRRISASYC